jgi:hypothetical protein
LQCQEVLQKKKEKTLQTEVKEVIEKRIKEDYTPSIAIGIIDSTGSLLFNFGKTSKE